MKPTKIENSKYYSVLVPKDMPVPKRMFFPKYGVEVVESDLCYKPENFDEYFVVGNEEKENTTAVFLYKLEK